MLLPAVAVFNRTASASYGAKKFVGSKSNASASMVSVFCVVWPAIVMSLFAAVLSTTVWIACACPRTVLSSVNSSGFQSCV